jgi:hypothetical protein
MLETLEAIESEPAKGFAKRRVRTNRLSRNHDMMTMQGIESNLEALYSGNIDPVITHVTG